MFAPAGAGPIYRVAESGGAPIRVTMGEGGHRFPQFLPDGLHFLFHDTGDRESPRGIYVGSLDGTISPLLQEDSSAAFVSSRARSHIGYVFFLRNRTLMAQPFDASSRRTTDDAFPVAEGVGQSGMTGHGDFSVSQAGTVLYSSGNLQTATQLTWVDRRGRVLEPVGSARIVDQATLSADGRQAIITRAGAVFEPVSPGVRAKRRKSRRDRDDDAGRTGRTPAPSPPFTVLLNWQAALRR